MIITAYYARMKESKIPEEPSFDLNLVNQKEILPEKIYLLLLRT